jgi:hypothetical protein
MVYCIASRIEGGEYLVISTNLPIGPFAWHKLEEAKSYFLPYYEVLGKEEITSRAYKLCLEKLLITHPVIIAFKDEIHAQSILDKWNKGEISQYCSVPVMLYPHKLFSMKDGFIDKFKELDIVRDIESITRIDSQGRIQLVKFTTHHLSKDEKPSIEILTEDHLNQALRERGFI